MKVKKLTLRNYKGLKFIEVAPTAHLVHILGPNGTGKTSLLRSILEIVDAKRETGTSISHDAKKGSAELELGPYVFTTRYTPKGRTLSIKERNEDGKLVAVEGKPRDIIKELAGPLHEIGAILDVNTPEGERWLRDIALEAAGVDTKALDAAIADKVEERKALARDAKDAAGALAQASEPPPGHAEAEVSLSDAMASIQALELRAREAEATQQAHAAAYAAYTDAVDEAERLTALLVEADAAKVAAADKTNKCEALVITDAPTPEAIETERAALATLEQRNAEARAGQAYTKLKATARTSQLAVEQLDEEVEAAREAKAAVYASIVLPGEGLTVDEAGIRHNNIPFAELSTGQKLPVSVALGIATRNEIDALFLDGGERLDDANFALVEAMAREAGVTIFVCSTTSGTVACASCDGLGQCEVDAPGTLVSCPTCEGTGKQHAGGLEITGAHVSTDEASA